MKPEERLKKLIFDDEEAKIRINIEKNRMTQIPVPKLEKYDQGRER